MKMREMGQPLANTYKCLAVWIGFKCHRQKMYQKAGFLLYIYEGVRLYGVVTCVK